MSSKCMRSILSLVGCLLGLVLLGASPALAAGCPNEPLRYGYGAYLPDCRAYEQASPVEKGGADASAKFEGVEASPTGGAVTFFVPLGLPGIPGSTAEFPFYVASRGVSNWSTVNLLPPASASWGGTFPFRVGYHGWSPDLTTVLATGDSVPPSEEPAIVLGDVQTGAYEVIWTGEAPGEVYLDAFSADDSRVVFEDRHQLLPPAVAGEDNVYEWDRASRQLYLVDVLPDGSAPSTGGFAASYNSRLGEAGEAEGGAEDEQFITRNAVSEDGSRLYFTAQADEGRDAGVDQLFLRENPTTPAASTVMVSESDKTNGAGPGGTDSSGPKPAAFWTASADGSRVFFTSPEELTNEASTGTADQGDDLYEYDLDKPEGQRLTDLTPDTTDPDGADVQGVVGASENGEYVYFVANGVLAENAEPGSCNGSLAYGIAAAGLCNLYVRHDGVTTFIAQLNALKEFNKSDDADWLNEIPNGGKTTRHAEVAADGRTLLFISQQRLTAYDNDGLEEIYRYTTPTPAHPSGRLLCVSCDPSGAPPLAAATLESTEFNQEKTGGSSAVAFVKRNLSANGDRVFFQSSDQLTSIPTGGIQNVYEWEADGEGSCESESQDGGCIYLISTGRSPDPSYFGDASANGDDVFLFTDQALVGQDKDRLFDVYDARVNGGLASQNPAPESVCSGEACRGEASVTSFATPASAALSAPGNLVSQPSALPVKKPLTRAQKLAKALAACRKKHRRKRARAVCEVRSRRLYGPKRPPAVKEAHR
jgi:hypothetical protein